MNRFIFVVIALAAAMTAATAVGHAAAGGATAGGDPDRGAQVFRACSACHSLDAGRQMTGPSLAGLWGRKAGSLEGFPRYSPALEASEIVWNAETLDRWLADPQAFVPGNRMTFPGIENEQARADLIAFLKTATEAPDGRVAARPGGPAMPMPGMASGDMPDLGALDPANLVARITYCADTHTYMVGTKAGETLPFWEFNLRFKTDSSDLGPVPGSPAILPAGMVGDRASVIFAAPGEISRFIKPACRE